MFFLELSFAFLVAVLLTAIFGALFRAGRPWTSLWVVFLIVFLAAWAGGVWVRPIGTPLGEVYWLPFLFMGLLFALLLAAAVPPTPGRVPVEPAPTYAEREVLFPVTAFLWVLLIGLAVAVLLGYLL